MFAGVIDEKLWPWYGRLFLRLFGGRTGDNRDWLAIDRWIEYISADLQRLFPAELRASASSLAHSA
jgi:menaquinone-dependent protoporphyrinogen oxidase